MVEGEQVVQDTQVVQESENMPEEERNFNNIIQMLFDFADGIIINYYQGHNRTFPEQQDALELLNIMNSQFADDVVAQSIFPNVFHIVLVKRRLLQPLLDQS
jgi:hypothetical protein